MALQPSRLGRGARLSLHRRSGPGPPGQRDCDGALRGESRLARGSDAARAPDPRRASRRRRAVSTTVRAQGHTGERNRRAGLSCRRAAGLRPLSRRIAAHASRRLPLHLGEHLRRPPHVPSGLCSPADRRRRPACDPRERHRLQPSGTRWEHPAERRRGGAREGDLSGAAGPAVSGQGWKRAAARP